MPGEWVEGDFRIGELLESGGQASVHRARQISMDDRVVAVKIYNLRLGDASDRARFDRERKAVKRLSGHPNVITVHGSGVLADRRPFFAMEFCPGGSYADRLRRDGPLPVDHALSVGQSVAAALAVAHRHDILHRDLKPSNILRGEHGQPVLADFGIAVLLGLDGHRTAADGALTPAHAAPELFRAGTAATRASDVYGLASTIYTLLAGSTPRFRSGARSPRELVDQPVPDITGVPGDLMSLLIRALSPDPDQRPRHAGEFHDRLRDIRTRRRYATGADHHRQQPRAAPALLPPTRVESPSDWHMAVDPDQPIHYAADEIWSVPVPRIGWPVVGAVALWLGALAPLPAGWWAPWVVALAAGWGMLGLAGLTTPIPGARSRADPGSRSGPDNSTLEVAMVFFALSALGPPLGGMLLYARRSAGGAHINLLYTQWMLAIGVAYVLAAFMVLMWAGGVCDAYREREQIVRDRAALRIAYGTAWIGEPAGATKWLIPLTVIPAVRVIRLERHWFSHAVVSGARVAFVRTVRWECGHYAWSEELAAITHNGRVCSAATDALADVRESGARVVEEEGLEAASFLVVRGDVSVDPGAGPPSLAVLAVDDAVDAIGRHLVTEPDLVDGRIIRKVLDLRRSFI